MSLILRLVRPDKLQNWIKVNAVGSLKSTARESWMAYLSANGGTGQTPSALEMSFLKSTGATGKTLADLWGSYSAVSGTSGGKNKEKIKNLYL